MKRILQLLSLMALVLLFASPYQAIADTPVSDPKPPTAQNNGAMNPDQERPDADFDQTQAARTSAEERIDSATRLFKESESISNSIPASVMEKAAGIAVIPEWTKAALIAGGSYGSGVLLARRDNGDWSNPLFVSLTGGSLGAQVGLKSSDLILVFANRSVLEQLAKDEDFTLGVDVSVAAGDVDKSKTASLKDAQVLTYKRTSGLFAGASLDGTVLQIQSDPTMAYYSLPGSGEEARGYFGKDDAPLYDQIIGSGGKAPGLDKTVIPDSADSLKDAVSKFVSSVKDRSDQ